MFFVLYLIGFLIAFSVSLYVIKTDSGKVLIKDFGFSLLVGLCSWIAILSAFIVWLCSYLEEINFWNKKVF